MNCVVDGSLTKRNGTIQYRVYLSIQRRSRGVSGHYQFAIASGDPSELWMSTSDDPSLKRLITQVPTSSGVRTYTASSLQDSVQIYLEAGQRYYMEALYKKGGSLTPNGDHLSVAWRMPDNTTQAVIPGTDPDNSSQLYLSAFDPASVPTGANRPPTARLQLNQGGNNLLQGTLLQLNAAVGDPDGTISKVEFFNGTTKIGEDLAAPFSFAWVPNAGTYSFMAKAFDNAGAVTESAPVPVTIQSTVLRTFTLGINLNGTAAGTLTIDGNQWLTGSPYTNLTLGATTPTTPKVNLLTATDPARATMLSSAVTGRDIQGTITGLANARYDLYFYVLEDNKTETMTVYVKDQNVIVQHSTGPGGTWQRLGPFRTTVSNSTTSAGNGTIPIRLYLPGTGTNINLSGIEVWKVEEANDQTKLASPLATGSITREVWANNTSTTFPTGEPVITSTIAQFEPTTSPGDNYSGAVSTCRASSFGRRARPRPSRYW